MSIQYWLPLENALSRTRQMLFRPFNIGRWFTMGFTVWLINLSQSGGSGAGSNPEFRTELGEQDWSGAASTLSESVSDFFSTGLALALIFILVGFGLLVGIILTWVSARMRFVWLENLTSGDHAIGRHWNQYGPQGNSYFFWQIGYFLLAMALILPLAFMAGLFGVLTGEGVMGIGSVLGWMLWGTATFMVVVFLLYLHFFAESFVTVIMHRRRLGVMAAWSQFNQLFQAHPGHFVAVGLMKFVLHIVASIVVVMAGLLTCCIGFAVMAIPYIGTVLLLPYYSALRYYDLEWIGQVDDELRLPPQPNEMREPPLIPGPPSEPESPTPDSDPTP